MMRLRIVCCLFADSHRSLKLSNDSGAMSHLCVEVQVLGGQQRMIRGVRLIGRRTKLVNQVLKFIGHMVEPYKERRRWYGAAEGRARTNRRSQQARLVELITDRTTTH